METVLERETRTITQTGQGNRQGRCEGCPRCDEPARAASAKSPIPSTKIDIPSVKFAVIVSCAATTWTMLPTWTSIPASVPSMPDRAQASTDGDDAPAAEATTAN